MAERPLCNTCLWSGFCQMERSYQEMPSKFRIPEDCKYYGASRETGGDQMIINDEAMKVLHASDGPPQVVANPQDVPHIRPRSSHRRNTVPESTIENNGNCVSGQDNSSQSVQMVDGDEKACGWCHTHNQGQCALQEGLEELTSTFELDVASAIDLLSDGKVQDCPKWGILIEDIKQQNID